MKIDTYALGSDFTALHIKNKIFRDYFELQSSGGNFHGRINVPKDLTLDYGNSIPLHSLKTTHSFVSSIPEKGYHGFLMVASRGIGIPENEKFLIELNRDKSNIILIKNLKPAVRENHTRMYGFFPFYSSRNRQEIPVFVYNKNDSMMFLRLDNHIYLSDLGNCSFQLMDGTKNYLVNKVYPASKFMEENMNFHNVPSHDIARLERMAETEEKFSGLFDIDNTLVKLLEEKEK